MEINRYFERTTRYVFDTNLKPADGWCQIDTSQDASYYGTWANPITLECFSYCEGDCTHVSCADNAEFIEYMRDARTWGNENGYGFAIDSMGRQLLIDRWISFGFGADLH